jgi:hypothetical protein
MQPLVVPGVIPFLPRMKPASTSLFRQGCSCFSGAWFCRRIQDSSTPPPGGTTDGVYDASDSVGDHAEEREESDSMVKGIGLRG